MGGCARAVMAGVAFGWAISAWAVWSPPRAVRTCQEYCFFWGDAAFRTGAHAQYEDVRYPRAAREFAELVRVRAIPGCDACAVNDAPVEVYLRGGTELTVLVAPYVFEMRRVVAWLFLALVAACVAIFAWPRGN